MVKKLKLLMSMATMCLAIAVLCFGVYAATKIIRYDIKGRITYYVEDVSVKITTTLYSSEEMFNSRNLRNRATHAVSGEFDTEDLTLIQLDGSDHHVYDSTVDDGSNAVLNGVDLEFTTDSENTIGTYFYIIEIENLGGFEIYAQPLLEKAYNKSSYKVPSNIVDYKTPNFISIDAESTNYIVFAMSLDNPANQISGDYELPLAITKARPVVDELVIQSIPSGLDYTIIEDNLYPYARIDGYYGPSGTVKIPSYIEGYPVKEIRGAGYYDGEHLDGAFYGNSYISSVWLPSTLEVLGNKCFENCQGLKHIYIPKTVAIIEAYKGGQPFLHCFNDNEEIDLYDHFKIYTDATNYTTTPSGWGPYWNRSNSTLDDESIEKMVRVFYGYTFEQYCNETEFDLTDGGYEWTTIQEASCKNVGISRIENEDYGFTLTNYTPMLDHEISNGKCTECGKSFGEYEIHFNNLNSNIIDYRDDYETNTKAYYELFSRTPMEWQNNFNSFIDSNDDLINVEQIYTIVPIKPNTEITVANQTNSKVNIDIEQLDLRYNVLNSETYGTQSSIKTLSYLTTLPQTHYLKITLTPNSIKTSTAKNVYSNCVLAGAKDNIRIRVAEEDDDTIYYNTDSEFYLPDCHALNVEFLGWYLDSNFTSNKIEKIAKGTTGDIELYPKFKYCDNKVLLNINGGNYLGNYDIDKETGNLLVAKLRYQEHFNFYQDQFFKSGNTFKAIKIKSGSKGSITDIVNEDSGEFEYWDLKVGQGDAVIDITWDVIPFVIENQTFTVSSEEEFSFDFEVPADLTFTFSIAQVFLGGDIVDDSKGYTIKNGSVDPNGNYFGFRIDDNSLATISGYVTEPGTYNIKLQAKVDTLIKYSILTVTVE